MFVADLGTASEGLLAVSAYPCSEGSTAEVQSVGRNGICFRPVNGSFGRAGASGALEDPRGAGLSVGLPTGSDDAMALRVPRSRSV